VKQFIPAGSIQFSNHDTGRDAMCSGKKPLRFMDAKYILDRNRRKAVAYHCPVCRAWHVGNPMRKDRI
jgi:hypothetical protein